MWVVGFNGKPQSGKDTLAKMLADRLDLRGYTFPIRVEYLSLPLRQIAYSMVGGVYENSMAHDGRYEWFKQEYFPRFGRTGRQLMIDISESFLKRLYGQTIFARMLLDRCEGFPGLVMVPDFGFQLEADELARSVESIYGVHIVRPAQAEIPDSRGAVSLPHLAYVVNDGGLDDLTLKANMLCDALIRHFNWKP